MDLTAIKIRISKAQMSVIWPGLDFIIRAMLAREMAESAQFSYSFRLYPLPPGFDAGTFNPAMMDSIRALWIRFQPKARTGGRFELNTIEIRAVILSVRVNLSWVRRKAHDQRSLDAESKRNSKLDNKSISELAEQTKRVIKSLERSMKRANRLFLKVSSMGEYDIQSETWRGHLLWIRFHLAYFKPLPPVLLGQRNWEKLIINRLVAMVEVEIQDRGYQAPEAGELRRLMRVFARYARRGRTGVFHPRFMLSKRRSVADQDYLVDFVAKRIELKEISNP